jgi:predicted DNA binding protein
MEDPSDAPYIVSLEIVNKQCKLLRTFKDLDIQDFKLIDVRSLSEGLTRHLVKIPAEQINNIPEGTFKKIQINKGTLEHLAWFESDGCEVCNLILSHGSFLVSGRSIENGALIYTFIAPNFEVFKSITSGLENIKLEPKILRMGKYKRTGILTERQERVLWLALQSGFFEFPRKINTIELSGRLGIALSTLSEILRRGTRRLLEHHFQTQYENQ